MAGQGVQALQLMKEKRQLQRIHAVYNELMKELNQLDDEQDGVIKKIKQHIDHDNIQKILSTIQTTK